ncbi:MFS family permease [Rhodococcus opacus]|nr:MFS family permease [Rhodococcus opacus]
MTAGMFTFGLWSGRLVERWGSRNLIIIGSIVSMSGDPQRCCLAMTLAISASPGDPPIVRIFAFMPLATPVSSGSTASTTMFDIAENASPKPTPTRSIAA